MAFCASCGQQLKPGARFCFNCGEQAAPGTTPNAPATTATVQANAAYAPPPAPPVAFSANQGRAMFVYAGLVLGVVATLYMQTLVFKQIDQLKQIQDIQEGRGPARDALTLLVEVEENDDAIAAANALLVITFLATAASFAFWAHRAYKNLLALNAGPLPTTPSFAVWSFLIPLANFVLGYLRIKEIWQASGPEGINSRGTGTNWKLVPLPLFISLWWFGFVILIVGRGILGGSKPGDDSPDAVDKLLSYDNGLVILALFSFVVSGLGVYAVMKITRRQNESYALMQAPLAAELSYTTA